MNKLIKAGAAVLAAMLVSTSAFADGITVSTDYSAGNVSVSCDFGIGKKPVTVRVIGPLSAPTDYEDVSEAAADKIFEESYVNQLYTDEAGSISLTLPIGNKAANYIIAMNCGGKKYRGARFARKAFCGYGKARKQEIGEENFCERGN